MFVMEADGQDVRPEPLEERRNRLVKHYPATSIRCETSIQNYTQFAPGIVTGSSQTEAAIALISFLFFLARRTDSSKRKGIRMKRVRPRQASSRSPRFRSLMELATR